eukprot:TRINITY_DN40119_c0_g1_i1.p1 TRINITY_DN40119_c0_g1~~TRINITY_DN40119_c0_g1_i1.p1  ORF type:complete len:103 (-),score=13.78 TRINITY_DN40119_c0_g1_i1:67-375(-)
MAMLGRVMAMTTRPACRGGCRWASSANPWAPNLGPSFSEGTTMASYFLDDRIEIDGQGENTAIIVPREDKSYSFREVRDKALTAATALRHCLLYTSPSPRDS